MKTIEFRVSGANSPAVASELADLINAKFEVAATVKPVPPPPPPADGERAVDPVHVALLAVDVLVAAFHIYYVFIKHPADHKRLQLIGNWQSVVDWAKTKLPTTVRMIAGTEDLPLDRSDPERLHHLTEKVAKAAIVSE